MTRRMKIGGHYRLVVTDFQPYQANMNILRLETAVRFVNQPATNHTKGFVGISALWFNGTNTCMPAEEFLQWASTQVKEK